MKTLDFIYSSACLQSFSFNGVGKALRSSLRCLLQQSGRGVSISSGMQTRLLSSEVATILEYESDQHHDEGKVLEKDAALHFAISQIAGGFGRESMLSLQRFFGSRYVPVISSGSLKLDLALGIGGLPKGRVVEIYGQEASGKTTLALHIIKEAQKLGGCCAFLDVENALDPSFVESLGVNTENLLVSRPDSAENSLSKVNTLVKSGSVDVVVVDSVAALVPQRELDSMSDGTSMDAQSRLMTQALCKLCYSLRRSQTLLIFINQVRLNTKPFHGCGHPKLVTCGGNALKFCAAIRLNIIRTGVLCTEDEVTGISVLVQVVKNKLAPAMKATELEIGFGRGFRREIEVLEMAMEHGLISRAGGSYNILGEIFKDKLEAERYLAENDGVLDELAASLREQLFESTT